MLMGLDSKATFSTGKPVLHVASHSSRPIRAPAFSLVHWRPISYLLETKTSLDDADVPPPSTYYLLEIGRQ